MWANVVKQAPTAVPQGDAKFTSAEGCKVVVVDANAIINGIRLDGMADKAVTIQEVLNEVRDKQSRQFLATLAIKLEVAEPSEESVKAGKYWTVVQDVPLLQTQLRQLGAAAGGRRRLCTLRFCSAPAALVPTPLPISNARYNTTHLPTQQRSHAVRT